MLGLGYVPDAPASHRSRGASFITPYPTGRLFGVALSQGTEEVGNQNSGVRSCRICEQGLYPKIRDRHLPGKISAGIPDSLAPELLQLLTSSIARIFPLSTSLDFPLAPSGLDAPD